MTTIDNPDTSAQGRKSGSADFTLSLYRVGDVVDVRDPMLGAWFEGEVIDVRRLRPQRRSTLPLASEEEAEPVKRPRHSLDSSLDSSSHGSFPRREERLSEVSWDDAFSYTVRLEGGSSSLGVTGRHLRPRAMKRIEAAKVAVGDQVMANYNVEDPELRGLWFDAVVTAKRRSRGAQRIQATIFQGPALSPRKECRLRFTDELFVPELPGTQRNAKERAPPPREGTTSKGLPDLQPRPSRRRPTERRSSFSSASSLQFGEVPGVRVGQRFAHRLELSDAKVHRPLTSAIDGDPALGACSLTLSGASVAEDEGEEVVFVGRELRSGLTAQPAAAAKGLVQLTRLNLTLARSCGATIDAERGANAGTRWREGRAVRVVRTARGPKPSKFAPKAGCRYDGLYKVVSYWPVVSASAARAWHFRLRRDDPSPAPWSADALSTAPAALATRRQQRKRRRAPSPESLPPPPPPKRFLRFP